MYRYRYEAKGIQSWILASDRLKELRGGSALIDEITALATQRVQETGGTLETSAAGQGTIAFKTLDQLRNFASDWRYRLDQHAPGLQVVHAWVEQVNMSSDAENVATDKLFKKLEAARNARLPSLPEAGPWTVRAPRTGLAASGMHRGEPADDAVHAKQDRVARAKDGELLGPEATLSDFRFHVDLQAKVWGDQPIAVIHADGNGLGARFKGCTPDQRKKLSERVSSASAEAARRAVEWLDAHLQREAENARRNRLPRSPIPARPIVLGGDDFTFITRASDALAFLSRWLDAFAQEMNDGDEDRTTASGGIAIVPVGFPFALAHKIAEDCCKQAKKPLRDEKGAVKHHRSTLVFERVTTSDADELSRSAVYVLDTAPIGAEDLLSYNNLWKVRDALDALPSGPIRQWVGTAGDASDARRAAIPTDPDWRRMQQVFLGQIPGERKNAAHAEAWGALQQRLQPETSKHLATTRAFLRDAVTLGAIGAARGNQEG